MHSVRVCASPKTAVCTCLCWTFDENFELLVNFLDANHLQVDTFLLRLYRLILNTSKYYPEIRTVLKY